MKKVLIIGMGKSGQAAKAFLEKKGRAILSVDQEHKLPPDVVMEEFDLVVVSPGVPPTDPYYKQAIEEGLEIIGEAQLAFQESKQPCIAITGTNGKTTVTLLVQHVLKAAGKKARALGNVGEPLSGYFLESDPEEIIVAELSSYQLETMSAKVFDVGVILNITPNHLDRHLTMEAYAKAKCRLQSCMKEGAPFYVSAQVAKEFGGLLKEGYQTLEGVESFGSIQYRHDTENAWAAWMICRAFGVDRETFIQALETFKKPAHRIEFVCEIEGVSYYDDSKGTSIDATIRAVEAMKGPVILIAGGMGKGASYEPWKGAFQEKVKKIVVLGQAAEEIRKELQGAFVIEKVEDLTQAVEKAAKGASVGDNILLSPGCSSLDMFRDYAHRGEEFQRIVQRRKKE